MNNLTTDLEKTLLLIDDDNALRERLAKAMAKRGFTCSTADSLLQARKMLEVISPNYVVIDMKLGDGYGLELVDEIHKKNPDARIIIVTGYGNIATAVAAIKHGAVDYLPKPIDADAIERALLNQSEAPILSQEPMSPDRVKWEHIQRVFSECNNNVSETARRLKMHRRTLQRILAKHAPRP